MSPSSPSLLNSISMKSGPLLLAEAGERRINYWRRSSKAFAAKVNSLSPAGTGEMLVPPAAPTALAYEQIAVPE
jgi:hypothetical protein